MLICFVSLLAVNEREKDVVALHLPIGPLKPRFGLDWYRDASPGHTSPLADDLAKAPMGAFGRN